MAEDKPARWPSTTITRRAFLSSSAVAVGTLAAVTACGGGGDSSAPVGGAPSPAPGPAPSPAPVPLPAPAPGPAPAPPPPPNAAVTYSTTFDLTENPISEGGRWLNNGGPDWTKVRTENGLAFGTNGPQNTYNDSYAYLSGFGPNQQVEAVVHVDSALLGDPHEVELLLRWADSAGNARGYECLFHITGSVQLMRWNGPFADFIEIPGATGRKSAGRALVTGDVIKATINGNTIIAYLNGVELSRVTDSMWTSGEPGIGFFKRLTGVNGGFAITSYTAASV
jgi:hypothetical protein